MCFLSQKGQQCLKSRLALCHRQLIVVLPSSGSLDMSLDKVQNRNKDACVCAFYTLYFSHSDGFLSKKHD